MLIYFFFQLAFLPFAYAMDSFREMLMMGFSNPEEFNTIWWMMREVSNELLQKLNWKHMLHAHFVI